jgi:glycosyltransferase involved in cell wall biosynthesis
MRQSEPLLSVLLPVYNTEKFVKQAILSILRQTYKNLEILVCDDCSTDNTIKEIESLNDDRIKLYKNSQNKGKNYTANFLFELSKGEYLTIHDADDISLPERFEKQINFLIQNPEHVLCGTNFVSFLGKGKVIDKSNLELESSKIRFSIKTVSQFHGPTIVFRKWIVSQVGGLYRYFDQPSDIDFTMRVAEKFQTANLSEHLYLYRHVPSSITNKLDGYTMKRLGDAKLLYFLAEQRNNNNGIDSLMDGDFKTIEKLMIEFTSEYQDDPSIALRRGVFRLIPMHMYKNAVQLAGINILKNFNVLNAKCFVYALLSFVYGNIKLALIREKIDLTFLK